MKITAYINKGNSFPVILEDGVQKCFVKLRAGMSGKYSLVSEWFGNKLAAQLGIKTQVPIWIELDSEIIMEDIPIEVKELIIKSLGINIGFEYQEKAKDININELPILSKKEANEIYLFDMMMINIDRSPDNMNLMKVGEEVIAVDYESSLLFQEIIENKDLLNDDRILQCLRTNPLYDEIEEEVISEFIARTEKISIQKIIDEIPLKLVSQEERNLFIKGIEEKNEKKWQIKETMKKLKGIKRETKEERKIRMKQNQEDFKRKFKENSNPNNA